MPRTKVYICAHPKDLPIYGAMLKQQIQGYLYCDVLTDQDFPEDRFTHYWLLREMRLFVLPVTRRLLTNPSIAMRNYRFAREHLIPVIPWLLEDGIEELFAERCGQMPFLRKDDCIDIFLKEFRMGRALVQRIRDAFDARVFLSYPPYDMRSAKQIKGLIHQCWGCANIGFPNRQEPEAGEIFVLVLNHNTLKDASRQIEEYQKAVALGLPIVAVEMTDLDFSSLRAFFPTVEETVDCYDESALEEAMLDALEKAQIRLPLEKTPEEEYLLGLAYLNGVDVEMERQKGAIAIAGAARGGWQEAKEKLRRIQYMGDGIWFERGLWHESDLSGF